MQHANDMTMTSAQGASWRVELEVESEVTGAKQLLHSLSKSIQGWKVYAETREVEEELDEQDEDADADEEPGYVQHDVSVIELSYGITRQAVADLNVMRQAVDGIVRIVFFDEAGDICYHEFELDMDNWILDAGHSQRFSLITCDVNAQQLFIEGSPQQA